LLIRLVHMNDWFTVYNLRGRIIQIIALVSSTHYCSPRTNTRIFRNTSRKWLLCLRSSPAVRPSSNRHEWKSRIRRTRKGRTSITVSGNHRRGNRRGSHNPRGRGRPTTQPLNIRSVLHRIRLHYSRLTKRNRKTLTHRSQYSP